MEQSVRPGLLVRQELGYKARLDYKELPEHKVRKALPELVYRDQPGPKVYKGQQVTMARSVLPVQLVRQDLGCKAQPDYKELPEHRVRKVLPEPVYKELPEPKV